MRASTAAVLCAVLALSASAASASDVVELSDGNFDDKMKAAGGAWLVEFFAPWCGHCKNLAPTWEKLATELKGRTSIAKVDCTANQKTCGRFGVRGYPTVLLFKDGPAGSHEKYQSARTVEAFTKFLGDKGALQGGASGSAGKSEL